MSEQSRIMILQGQEEKIKNIHYEIDVNKMPLGEGGTGIVRQGVLVDENTGIRKDVAIKFLFNDLSDNVIQRSRREAEIRINSENLIEMLGFVQVGETDLYGKGSIHYHVVSELLRGVMLLDMLNGDVPDSVYMNCPKIKAFHDELLSNRYSFALKIVQNVLSGIMALHDNGYIHRDIDPSNVMITEEGKVKLIDLGICKKIDSMNTASEHLTSVGQFVGKAAYAAPELVRGDLSHQNTTTDIYSVGIMLYQIITGSLPFRGTIQEVLDKQLKDKMPLQNIKNKKVRDLIRKATEKKQTDRFKTAAEFRVAIDSIEDPSSESGNQINVWFVTAIISVVGIIIGVLLGLLF